jgi:hypothetical protein
VDEQEIETVYVENSLGQLLELLVQLREGDAVGGGGVSAAQRTGGSGTTRVCTSVEQSGSAAAVGNARQSAVCTRPATCAAAVLILSVCVKDDLVGMKEHVNLLVMLSSPSDASC